MDNTLTRHWTERNIDAFVQRTGADFMLQIQKVIDASGARQAQLASTLGVTPGRVSQVLNSPGNLTLRKVVQYARAIGRKVSIVVYDDGDEANLKGPIDGEIFVSCWNKEQKPTDFSALRELEGASANAELVISVVGNRYVPNYNTKRSATLPHAKQSLVLKGMSTADNRPSGQHQLGAL